MAFSKVDLTLSSVSSLILVVDILRLNKIRILFSSKPFELKKEESWITIFLFFS
jgi:hypothetical protein